MRTARLFTPPPAAVAGFLRAWPLAMICSTDADALHTSLIPLIVDDADPARIIGHFARANPHVEALERTPRATALFLGPHGYVSPSWMRDRTQAPTWNFCCVEVRMDVRIDRSRSMAQHAVDMLTARMEQGRPDPWHPRELGERRDTLLQAVVGFDAAIVEVRAKFKLGQNERDDVLADILRAPALPEALAAAMREANAARLGTT